MSDSDKNHAIGAKCLFFDSALFVGHTNMSYLAKSNVLMVI